MSRTQRSLPLEGIRVLDFGHTVMGPSCGLILADLGADVIKVEPAPRGERTRELRGFGAGYFGFFNRNKRSVAVDLKTTAGHDIVWRLAGTADVLIENYAPGTMDRLGLGFEATHAAFPRLIYCEMKGFFPGPYENRLALDEVVQMMSGLAYMTGPTGRPIRAGTSIADISGGLFAALGIVLALQERERTGRGKKVESALFEATVFFMGQHLCYASQTPDRIPPMPERVSAWSVYETFLTSDQQSIFVAITSDAHWQRFGEVFGLHALVSDPNLATNNARILQRARILPVLRQKFAELSLVEAERLCDAARIPFSRVSHPQDLFSDPHLAATGGLLDTELPDGARTKLPRLPVRIEGFDFGLRRDPPGIGEHTAEVLGELGYGPGDLADLEASGVVVVGDPAPVSDRAGKSAG